VTGFARSVGGSERSAGATSITAQGASRNVSVPRHIRRPGVRGPRAASPFSQTPDPPVERLQPHKRTAAWSSDLPPHPPGKERRPCPPGAAHGCTGHLYSYWVLSGYLYGSRRSIFNVDPTPSDPVAEVDLLETDHRRGLCCAPLHMRWCCHRPKCLRRGLPAPNRRVVAVRATGPRSERGRRVPPGPGLLVLYCHDGIEILRVLLGYLYGPRRPCPRSPLRGTRQGHAPTPRPTTTSTASWRASPMARTRPCRWV
jgi:hypothetical protein